MNKKTMCLTLGLVLLLFGCTTREIYTFNSTIEKECAVCQDIPDCDLTCADIPDCICNCEQEECKTQIKTIIAEGCTKSLSICHTQKDFLNDELFDCLTANETQSYQNLSDSMRECQNEKEELQDRLDDIEEALG